MEKFKRILSLLLALILALGSFPTGISAVEAQSQQVHSDVRLEQLLSKEQIEAFELADRSGRSSGLVGFDNNWKLDEFSEGEKVSVIVEFVHQPVIMQQIEAYSIGENVSLSQAERSVKQDHEKFVEEMNELFGVNLFNRANAPYTITATYTDAINGAAVTLPAENVEDLPGLDTVWAVYPDSIVQADPVKYQVTEGSDGNTEQAGMADTREFLGIEDIHEFGIKGEGITVGVLDTGVDYNHPDLKDAFSDVYNGSDDEMRVKGKINGKYIGRNFVDYEEAGFDNLPLRNSYNPMETTYSEWEGSEYPEVESSTGSTFYTAHGTHVSGTIAGRGVNEPISALGMAPEATLLSYRVLGPYGSGYTSWILSALDKVADDGCDVVNMSLGAARNDPQYPTSIAVNNMIAQHNIVFAISAGNLGPGSSSLGAPGTSSLAIIVGNGTVDSINRYVDISSATTSSAITSGSAITPASTVELSLLTNNFANNVTSEDDGSWSMIPNLDEHQLVLIETVNSSDTAVISDVEIGNGTSEEFEAMSSNVDLEDKIAVVYRGQAFVETSKIAKKYGLAAVIVITNEGGQYFGYQDEGSVYIPLFLSKNKTDSIDIIQEALDNDGYLTFDNYQEESVDGGLLNDSSSRGPVGGTMDIKPDIVGPGTQVLSTVPFYETNETNKTDPTAEGAYDYSYQRYSGTSMSSPHLAGIAALLLGYSRDYNYYFEGMWSPAEVKARIMNTANQMPEYSVHEVGAGYVNPFAAMQANSYITVDYDNVYFSENENYSPIIRGDGKLSSLNFGTIPVNTEEEQSVTLHTTIHDRMLMGTGRTYNISYVPNYEGFLVSDEMGMISDQSMWESSGIEFEFNSAITVEAGRDANFDITLRVGENISNENTGIYEGNFIITCGAGESYVLPFSVSLINDEIFGTAFINQPALTTAGIVAGEYGGYLYDPEIVHFESSLTSDLYFSLKQNVDSMYIIFASEDLADSWEEDKWIGEAGIGIVGSDYVPGGFNRYSDAIGPVYLKYDSDSPEGYTLETFEPGHYKAIIFANTWMGIQLSEPMDFYVDNELPELTIDDLIDEDGKYYLQYKSDNVKNAVITGNIFDDGLKYMHENSILYNIYDSEDDYHMPEPDQALNAIFASVSGASEYVQADIMPNGDFELNLSNLNSSGITDITLYYLDSFSAGQFATSPGDPPLSAGFDPEGPSLNQYYGGDFAFYGLNKGVQEITLKHEGAFVSLKPESSALEPGEEVQFIYEFNKKALEEGFNSISSWESNNENVVTVDSEGRAAAINPGTAIITVISNQVNDQVIKGNAKVTVVGVGDGVSIPAGSHVFFGAGKYEDYEVQESDKDNPVGGKIPYINHYTGSEIISHDWEVMGEEKVNGIGDGYLTIASMYGIKTLDYADEYYVPYSESKLIEYLNEELLDDFTDLEQSVIPYFDVEINGEIIENQRAYLPWGIDRDSEEYLANSVFWTAGQDAEYDNSFHGSSDRKNLVRNINLSKMIYMTYYLRNSDDDSEKIRVAGGGTGNVETRDSWEYFGTGHNWNTYGNYERIEIGTAVRPVTKLDMSSVVYAYKFKQDGWTEIITDDDGYVYGQPSEEFGVSDDVFLNYNVDTISYKLSVLGGNNGEDVGVLSGIGSEHQNIEAGQKIVFNDVTSSEYGQDYKIAYKIVGDVNGERQIVKYGEVKSSEDPQDIILCTNELNPGNYKAYVWLQKYNPVNSYEAGKVEKFAVNIEPVELPDNVSDGVVIETGSYIYYGTYKHAQELDLGINNDTNTPVISQETNSTPILWKVMGEEMVNENKGDGYLSLMSKFVLDTSVYSANSRVLVWENACAPYKETSINMLLNKSMSDSFTNAEYNSIPFFNVDRIDYYDDGESGSFNEKVSVPNQKLYLPWGIKFTENAQKAVMWSAGKNILPENSVEYKYSEDTVPEMVKATLKNGEPATYWLGAATCIANNYIKADGKFYVGSFFMPGVSPKNSGGVRPVTKLNSDGVVYAQKIGEEIEADVVNYIAPLEDEIYYKLTVVGPRGGKDIGTLENIPEKISVSSNANEYIIKNVVSSENGQDYSIAYKIVGDKDGERVILKYNEIETSDISQDISVDTTELADGQYELYVWMQKNNEINSNETGVVYNSKLIVGDSGSYSGSSGSEDSITYYTITAEAEEGGSISPSKATVKKGGNKVFKIKADEGYKILDVMVDGVSVGAKESYEFKNVSNNHTIKAKFEKGDSAEQTLPKEHKFEDVSENDWFQEAVNYVYEKGILRGYSEKEFGPHDNVTRGQFVTTLGRLAEYMGKEIKGYSNNFKDVEEGQWYTEYVSWAAANNIVKGYDNETFGPKKNITREEMAVMLIRFTEYMDIEPQSGESVEYTDKDLVSSWAYEGVVKASEAGLMKGSQGRFRPQNVTPRCEVAQVIMNLMVSYIDK